MVEKESPLASATRYVIYAGAAATVILMLNGFRLGLARLWRREAMTDLFAVVPLWTLVGAWLLYPYWGASRLQRGAPATRAAQVVVLLAILVVVALAANSYLVTSFFVGGSPHPTADGMTIMLIPVLQWLVLGAGGLLIRMGRAAGHDSMNEPEDR